MEEKTDEEKIVIGEKTVETWGKIRKRMKLNNRLRRIGTVILGFVVGVLVTFLISGIVVL